MAGEHLIDRILEDEGLAGGLDEPEAAALVKALVARATTACQSAKSDDAAEKAVGDIRRFGRAVAKVVEAWRDAGPAKAAELAKANALPWPPAKAKTPADVLAWLLSQRFTAENAESAEKTPNKKRD